MHLSVKPSTRVEYHRDGSFLPVNRSIDCNTVRTSQRIQGHRDTQLHAVERVHAQILHAHQILHDDATQISLELEERRVSELWEIQAERLQTRNAISAILARAPTDSREFRRIDARDIAQQSQRAGSLERHQDDFEKWRVVQDMWEERIEGLDAVVERKL